MKKLVKIGLIVIIALSVAAAGIYSYTRPIETETLTAEPALWESSFTETGEAVVPDDSAVYARYGGLVAALNIDDGQRIKAGDILLEFDKTELNMTLSQLNDQITSLEGERSRALSSVGGADRQLDAQAAAVNVQIEAAAAAVQSAETRLSTERTTLTRLEKDFGDAEFLFELGDIAENDLAKAREAYDLQAGVVTACENALSSARAQIAALEAQRASVLAAKGQGASGLAESYDAQISSVKSSIDDVRKKLEASELTAGSDAVVRTVFIEKGSVIPPGMQLFSTYEPSECKIECFIRVKDAFYVRVGDEAPVILALRDGDMTFTGKVSEIGGEAVPFTTSLGLAEKRVRITLTVSDPGWSEMKKGYPVDVKFTLARIENAISVPKTAIAQTESGEAVWVVEDGVARSRAVVRGDESTAYAVITSGLNAGDVYVKDAGLDGLTEGARVASIGP